VKVQLRNTTFEAFQFVRHRFEELPEFARSYSIRHGADTAHLYRHHTQNRIFVPAVGGGHIPAMTSDWLLWDGEAVTVVTNTNFQRFYKTVTEAPPFIVEDNAGGDPL